MPPSGASNSWAKATTALHGARKRWWPPVLVVVALALWARWRPFRAEVEGSSMAPELQPGEWLVAVRPRRLRPGCLVVVEHPERPGFELVKRLAALPGDVVGALRLAPDRFWIVGEDAASSADSRRFGPVQGSAIRGRIVFRYRPVGRLRRFG